MKQRIRLLTIAVCLAAWQVACSGGGGGSIQPPPPSTITSVTVSPATASVEEGKTETFTAAVTGTGNYSSSVTWTASAGTISSSGIFTAPGTPGTVTVTATSTQDKTKTGTAAVTVGRTITISLPQPIPNNEIYSDFGMFLVVTINCTGCQSGDTLNVMAQNGYTNTDPYQSVPWVEALNSTGWTYEPGLIKIWASGADGATSNTLWFTFDGSENIAAEDPSSGEIYYAYSGNGTQGSFSVLKFKQDGTADGNFQAGGYGIAIDDQTHDVVFSSGGGGNIYGFDGTIFTGFRIPTSSSTANVIAVSASGGLACATQPTIDSASCFYLPTQPVAVQPFTFPNLPSGSQPTAIKVLDGSHVVVYGRGDQTLRWYTISGSTATASGTLQLSEFTATDANYWKQYPATGGWEIVEVGSTLGVMGQVVNSDGTVGQELALVNNTNHSLIQYVDLPAGTVHIAADPTNNAVVAEYVDFSGSSPVLRFERIYVDTGNSVLLTSTSNLVPGAGFLVTNDGSQIAVFVEGKADFELNQ
jgi:Bacterial Ig-like domain (group 2)